MKISVGDVVQLAPSDPWGPLLCIVSEVHTWGVQCYALIPSERGKPPHRMPYRSTYEDLSVIGCAAWVIE